MRTRRGDKLFEGIDDQWAFANATETPGIDLIESVGAEPFAGNRPLLLGINQLQLLMGAPADSSIPPESIVCVLEKNLPEDIEVLSKCVGLSRRGYSIAIEGVPANVRNNSFVDLAEYIILDYADSGFHDAVKAVTPLMRRKKIIILNIPDMEAFERIGKVPQALYSGAFYSQPVTKGNVEISPVKINALSLLSEINREDFDLSEIAATVGRDPSLSISLLRFINSGASGVGRKIDSIKNAVAILGQKEVRRWASVAISVSLSEDRPGEITRLSLVRAKFAENLAGVFEMGIMAPGLFLAGLFSLLDVILEKPMEQAIAEVAVDERVHRALVDRAGPFYPVLELIYAYEKADWDQVSICMVKSNVDLEDISDAFLQALIWYKQMLESIDEEFEGSLE